MGKANGKVWINDDYYLKYTTNRMVDFEDISGVGFMEAFGDLEDGKLSFKVIRALIWSGLKHQNEDLTSEEAGDILDEVGLPKVLEKLPDAMSAIFPDDEKTKQAKNLQKVAGK
ncbi:hypothetical protein QGM71_01300 [Virgibacillus sp. C22-A2]|uniref:Tail assembly chaperone n=1 Tax=Virgibacillus tibetensis TaxID=3042313 RepID=A0ABU6K9X6_9BACI|nr:hypothetical protein [Virgibacillus sp. C22-A2]